MNVPSEKKYAVLYDGHCVFCRRQLERLKRLARPGALEAVDFQEPEALARFPMLSHAACMEAMHVVTPDGLVYRGFEAAVQAVVTRPILGKAAYLYYLPGLRQLLDHLYAWLAAHRYRLAGRCPDGACALHLPGRQTTGGDVERSKA
jgi:predicted DCC family thiol-disulfide oxidoreductase YuxK